MARPIDGNELVDTLKQIVSDYTSHGMYPSAFPVEYAIEIVEKMPTLTPPDEWVSVEDELPARDGIYLVYTTRGSVTTAHFYAEKIFRDDYKRKASWQGNRNVTHWTPLPAPPDRRPQESQEDT